MIIYRGEIKDKNEFKYSRKYGGVHALWLFPAHYQQEEQEMVQHSHAGIWFQPDAGNPAAHLPCGKL